MLLQQFCYSIGVPLRKRLLDETKNVFSKLIVDPIHKQRCHFTLRKRKNDSTVVIPHVRGSVPFNCCPKSASHYSINHIRAPTLDRLCSPKAGNYNPGFLVPLTFPGQRRGNGALKLLNAREAWEVLQFVLDCHSDRTSVAGHKHIRT